QPCADKLCAAGAACVGGTCVAPLKVGEACESSFACASLRCSNKGGAPGVCESGCGSAFTPPAKKK
ncbi:MAG TPA: hypothetical protein VHB21_09725, partial [Minicystis sp.]|nr:hypothetical protein [Minicystis sp.]